MNIPTKVNHPPEFLPSNKNQHKSLNTWLPITLILLIATGLYGYQLGTESFWNDEFYSVYDAQAIPEAIPSTRPVYFLLLSGWMALGGDGDIWLRSLSIIFALGSIFISYCLGSRLLGRSVGLITALLMTLSPIFVNHAQEVRMYTLIVFLSLAGTLAFTFVLKKVTIASATGWIGARVLGTLTNPTNILLFFPDFLLLLWKFRHRRRLLMGFVISLLVIGIVTLPWTVNIYQRTIEFSGGWAKSEPPPSPVNVISRLTNFTAYWPLKSIEGSPWEHFYKLYTVMLVGILAGCFLNKPVDDSPDEEKNTTIKLIWLTLWVILPGLTMFAISSLFVPVWVPRYLLFFSPYLLILLAIGFLKIRRWQPKLALFIVAMYAVAVTGGLYDYYTKVYRADWRGAAQMISQQEKPDDVLAFYLNKDRPLEFILERYYTGNLPINLLTIENKKTGQASLPAFRDRLWLVHNDNRNISEKFLQQVQSQYEVQQFQDFKNEIGWKVSVKVFLLTNKNQATTDAN